MDYTTRTLLPPISFSSAYHAGPSSSSRRNSSQSPVLRYSSTLKRRRSSSVDRDMPFGATGRAGPSTLPAVAPAYRAPLQPDSDAEEGEIEDDDPPPPRRPEPEVNPRASPVEFPPETMRLWYEGRDPSEPARPGVLDESITVADYTEIQLLILDLLGFGLSKEQLFSWNGLDKRLLVVAFAELKLHLPDSISPDDIPPLPPNSAIPPSFAELGFIPNQAEGSRRERRRRSLRSPRKPHLTIDAERASRAHEELELAQSTTRAQSSSGPAPTTTTSSSTSISLIPDVATTQPENKMELLRAQLKKRKAQQLATAKEPDPSSIKTPAISTPSTAITSGLGSVQEDALATPPVLPPKPPQSVASVPSLPLSLPAKPEVPSSPLPAPTPTTPIFTASTSLPPKPDLNIPTPTQPTTPAPTPPIRKASKQDLVLQEKLARLKAMASVRNAAKPSTPVPTPSPVPTPTSNETSAPTSRSEPNEDALPTPSSATTPVLQAPIPVPVVRERSQSIFLPPASPIVSISRPPTRSYTSETALSFRNNKRLRATDLMEGLGADQVPLYAGPLLPAIAFTQYPLVIDVSDDEEAMDEGQADDEEMSDAEPEVEEEPVVEPVTVVVEDTKLAEDFLDDLADVLASPMPAPVAKEPEFPKSMPPPRPSSGLQAEIERLRLQIAKAELKKLEAKKKTLLRTRPSTPDQVKAVALGVQEGMAEDIVRTLQSHSTEVGEGEEWQDPIVLEREAGLGALESELDISMENASDVPTSGDSPNTHNLSSSRDFAASHSHSPAPQDLTDYSEAVNGQGDSATDEAPEATTSDQPVEDGSEQLIDPAPPATTAHSSPPQTSYPAPVTSSPLTHWSSYHSPFGWYARRIGISDPTGQPPLHIKHARGFLDLGQLWAKNLRERAPGKVLCAFEVPNGGTCMDNTCTQAHLRDYEPTDEDAAAWLADAVPGIDAARWRTALSATPVDSRDLATRIGKALAALGLR